MNPYPKYKDSGVEWIGDIPIDWTTIPIKRLSPVKRGASPRPIADPKYFDDNGEYAWVRIADVSASNRYLENTTQQLSEIGSSLSVKQFPGDLFLSIAGTVGKPIITKIKCCIHDGFVYFPNLKVDPEYLYYVFSTGEPYKGLGKWGTQLNLNTETVGYIPISLPPYEHEISRIVKFLDEKTAQIDDLISKKQKIIALLKEERAAIINQAVTKGINPDAPMKDSGIEWLGEIPVHWEVKRLKYVAKTVQTGTTPSSLNPEYFIDGEIDWFIPVDFGDSLFLSNSNRKLNRLAIDDNVVRLYESNTVLLVGIGATLGKVGIVKRTASSNQQINAISFKDDYNPNFGAYYFQAISDIVVSMSNAATLPILNQTQTKEIMAPVPPQKEQDEIVGFINQITTKIDQTISKIKKQIELLKEFRTALISEVVTGKIDVRDEGPK